jgi:hypothetical protein
VRDGLPIIVCRFVQPRISEDRRSGIGVQRIVPSTRGKFRQENLAGPRMCSSSGDVTLRFSARLENLRNRDAVQIPLDGASVEGVHASSRSEHYPLSFDQARSRQAGNFVNSHA